MYAIETFTDGSPSNGNLPWLDSLIWGGLWTSPGDQSGLTTISIAAVTGNDPYGYLTGTSMEWSSASLSALTLALGSWEAVALINFEEVNYLDADVWFWQGTDQQAFSALGWSDVPSYSFGEPLFTVFNGEHFTWSSEALVVGGYGYITLIHELGHLLGLAHPHDGGYDGDLFPGVETSFGDYGNDDLNQGIFTTMSYNDGWVTEYSEHADISYGWQGTPMALDIAAIQYIYGANYDYNTGSNTYTLPETNASGTFWSCIWDAGGSDTISNEGNTEACNINLNQAPLIGANAGGYVSWVPGVVGGYTIANGTIIENAVGGNANDVLIGNSAANTLDGNTGADTLVGGDGNDIYVVDNAADVVTETNASLTQIDEVRSSVTRTLGANLENLTLTGTAATNGTGNSLANTLTGNSAANTLDGNTGNDILNGGLGNDMLTGGTGVDYFDFTSVLNGTTNVDTITDFNRADDFIRLDNAVMALLGTTTGALTAVAFVSGAGRSAAADSSDRIIYNTTTGDLYYDADGTGNSVAIKIALIGTSSNHPTLDHTDFLII